MQEQAAAAAASAEIRAKELNGGKEKQTQYLAAQFT